MSTITVEFNRKQLHEEQNVFQATWQRIILLIVLGYEAAGCLVGGSFLVIAPDGRLMDMPVSLMHGAFTDFLIPGIILFGLGVLTTLAFFSVFRKTEWDWLMASLAMGGLSIWFYVEIIILQELHWLHLMWGAPVFIGWVLIIPLIVARHPSTIFQQGLLACGIISSLWYAAINIYVPLKYEGYSMVSVTVSELSAIGAPTRILWVLLVMLYPLLFAAFGWGVWQAAGGSRTLRMVGALILIYSVMNFYWPPMHQREVIAAGGGTLTDTLHIAWAMMTVSFMMLLMGFGALVFGRTFRMYTIVTWITFVVFGVLTGVQAPGINTNQSTPNIGLFERINIGAFLLWVVVFALMLLKKENSLTHVRRPGSGHGSA
jgi:hypothetical protein